VPIRPRRIPQAQIARISNHPTGLHPIFTPVTTCVNVLCSIIMANGLRRSNPHSSNITRK
jgi:hypothetical protein